MSYAIRKDGTGWRSVNSAADVDVVNETFSTTQPPLIVPTATQALRAAAQSELDHVTGPRGTIIRCMTAGVAVPLAWTSYVQALRAIANGTNTTATALPSPPLDAQGRIAYPTGT